MKRKIIDFFAGNIGLQKYFELLFRAGMYGMNYGKGGNFKKSGELFVAKYIRSKFSHQKETLTVFDVGAHKGFYSLELAATLSQRPFTIYSFEPSKEAYASLQQAVGSEKSIIAINFGLGEKKEMVKLFNRNSLSGFASVYQRQLAHFGIEMSNHQEINIQTIDDYCASQNIDRIHFLKLDVEGHEFKCLLGGGEMLNSKKIDFIQFEFGGCNIDSRTYFQDFWYLLKDSYNFYRIVKNGLVPVTKYNERLEIFKNINFLAELKS